MFIGAACNPFADPLEFRAAVWLKIRAGADFIQTQCIYNMTRFRQFIQRASRYGLLEMLPAAGVT
jgi:methylenetetrahydrofolate reductase (NADPH)